MGAEFGQQNGRQSRRSGRRRLAVTGSIACGKSYLCRALCSAAVARGLCAVHLDVDLLRARALEDRSREECRALQEAIITFFGAEVALQDGSVNRRRLAEVAYEDPEALVFLGELIDPFLCGEIRRALSGEFDLMLVEWALIAEKSQLALTDYHALLVECFPETQLARLAGSDLPAGQAQKRMALQLATGEKLRAIQEAQRAAGTGVLFRCSTETTPTWQTATRLLDTLLHSIPTVDERRSCD